MISQDDAKDHDSPWAELIQQSLRNPRIGKISAYRREFPVYPGSENCIYTIEIHLRTPSKFANAGDCR
jgi:hypothetical protein